MKTKLPTLWASESPEVRREPTGSELSTGFTCGAADQHLFNELIFRALGIEQEVGNAIIKASIAFSEADLFQLAKAIRSQRMNWLTAGGTANAITLTPDPAFAALADLAGVPLRILMPFEATGPATLNVSGLGAVALTRAAGFALQPRDFLTNQIVEIVYDGTRFQMWSLAPTLLPSLAAPSVFTSPGVVSHTVPNNVFRYTAEVWAGGGGGGGAVAGAAGSGGNGGGYARKVISVTPGSLISITVGSGGAAGNAFGSNGAIGGDSSVGSIFSATGGGGGLGASAAGGVLASTTFGNGVGGDFGITGQQAPASTVVAGVPFGSSGGGAFSSSGTGFSVAQGVVSTSPGGGGGGGANGNAGAPGANGMVILTPL